MKSIVVHISESVCKAHNRNPDGHALIEAGRTFGTVESFESAMAAEKTKWQTEFNQMKAQYEDEVKQLKTKLETIEEKGVTDEELAILKLIRAKSAKEAAGYETEIKRRDDHLATIVAETDNWKQQIKAMFGF